MTTSTLPTEVQPPKKPTRELIGTIAKLLLVGAGFAATYNAVQAILSPLGYSAKALWHMLRMLHRSPVLLPFEITGAWFTYNRQAHKYRAAFLLNATIRIQRATANGVKFEEALHKEEAHFEKQRAAETKRYEATSETQQASASYGVELGWYATLDSRTDPSCRAANGHNFNVVTGTPIGYPGGVHLFCRCKPGPPFPGGGSVSDAIRIITHSADRRL